MSSPNSPRKVTARLSTIDVERIFTALELTGLATYKDTLVRLKYSLEDASE